MKIKNFKVANIVLVNHKNELLLQLRDYKQNITYPGYWGLIGGSVEKNENSLDAIKREIREEINCKIKNIKKLATIMPTRKIKLIIFRGEINELLKNISLTEGQKIDYFKFHQLKKLHMPLHLKNFVFRNKDKILNPV
jgi:8-oxo-dGTP diphosphatase